ncbi:carboxypeptidase-like regulatory domain-containing protein [Vogesella oryzae]|uniref:carboxypeptidase-like regulatory domain-containing protein n=1 Tax=Vogesella oryzae TaxID=1735285 RepID=UPI0015829E30|nr:carboxypeptidase-like regulatory domain-containing protein [Vogesella oryzae]
MKPAQRILSALIVGVLSLPAFAQESMPDLPRSQTTAAGVRFIAGGIGHEQQQAMSAVQSGYNLRLTFARPKSGEYLADVRVMITDSKQNSVLDTVANGPFLYARLPAGNYKVTAMFEGQQQSRKVSVGAYQQPPQVFYFAE